MQVVEDNVKRYTVIKPKFVVNVAIDKGLYVTVDN